jgi:hypothetical protein
LEAGETGLRPALTEAQIDQLKKHVRENPDIRTDVLQTVGCVGARLENRADFAHADGVFASGQAYAVTTAGQLARRVY